MNFVDTVHGVELALSDNLVLKIEDLDDRFNWELEHCGISAGAGDFCWIEGWHAYGAMRAEIWNDFRGHALYSRFVLPSLMEFCGGRIVSDTCRTQEADRAWQRAGAVLTPHHHHFTPRYVLAGEITNLKRPLADDYGGFL